MHKPPPVPPQSRSPKGNGEPAQAERADPPAASPVPDPDKQGQQGNAKVNTTHQGYQQDR